MDPLSCLLDGPRARGAFVLRSSMSAPWSIRIEDEAPLTLVMVVRGAAWIRTGSGEQRGLRAGDIAVLRGPEPYLVSDEPGRPAQAIIDAGQACRAADERQGNPMGPQGVRLWGNWFARPGTDAPGWYHAQRDPVVGPALALIHDHPAQPWSVASLAAAARSSRATFARRFHELVGQSPITYLTSWRLTLAADLLSEGDETLEAVARQVGYGDAFALSSAFKRVRGISPSDHRQAARASAGASP
ncbi:MAG TPA: AraC family transcriptional regulator [Streptosporangiaceae bacterium]|jgi:AraC-like DNA-binding protein